jgi:predicted aldo/keto reductase-like oxidoreductase
MDRRMFLKSAALALAGTALANVPLVRSGEATSNPATSIRNAQPGMPYRPFGKTNVMVSPLGFGMMRLPMLPDGGGINEELSKQMVRYAIDRGLNYVDTSYLYLGGKSEEVTGRILQDGYRERVYLATKSPLLITTSADDFEQFLDRQLERLNTDAIDFYLLHMITHKNWESIVKRFGLIDKMEKAKERGKVRHIGFSIHASFPIFKQVVDATSNWDFCQIQLNYLDTEYEVGLAGLKYASDRGLGVAIMEPLRGGYLADPPPEVEAIFANGTPKRSPIEWAFDYLWNMPEVGVVLSGMSAMKHVTENIDLAKRASTGMLTTNEKAMIARVVRQYNELAAYPCTGCELCHPCPADVAIAQNIMFYNQYKVRGDRYIHRYRSLPTSKDAPIIPYGLSAAACTGCGQCKSKCPMGIDVPMAMQTIHETFGK